MAAPASAYTTVFGQDEGNGTQATPILSLAANEAFLSDLSVAGMVGVGTETFEEFATGASAPLSLTFGTQTGTLTGNGSITSGLTSTSHFPISGTQFWNNVGTSSNTIAFSSPQAAFGFWATDASDNVSGPGDPLEVSLTQVGGSVVTVPVLNEVDANNGNVLYFGLYTTDPTQEFTSASILINQGDDYVGYDDITIGTLEAPGPTGAVPEPATLSLLGVGLSGLIAKFARRRNR
jgi:hypothetical protein